jgi:hypothetical protein
MRTILSSWKEIASYLGKGVRTVQRWERELDLPVRRPKPNEKQIVLAFPEELDAWLKHQSRRPRPSSSQFEEFARLRDLVQQTMMETRRLQEATEQLLKRYSNGRNGDIDDRRKAS